MQETPLIGADLLEQTGDGGNEIGELLRAYIPNVGKVVLKRLSPEKIEWRKSLREELLGYLPSYMLVDYMEVVEVVDGTRIDLMLAETDVVADKNLIGMLIGNDLDRNGHFIREPLGADVLRDYGNWTSALMYWVNTGEVIGEDDDYDYRLMKLTDSRLMMERISQVKDSRIKNGLLKMYDWIITKLGRSDLPLNENPVIWGDSEIIAEALRGWSITSHNTAIVVEQVGEIEYSEQAFMEGGIFNPRIMLLDLGGDLERDGDDMSGLYMMTGARWCGRVS